MTSPRALPRWYTIRQLANYWGVQPVTIHVWLFRARCRGVIPTPEQTWLYRRNSARRDRLLREDFVRKLAALNPRSLP
jgi:hypothetical protein